MGRGYALIVGVSQPGPGSGWNAAHLPGVDEDVRQMSAFLSRCKFQVETLQNSRAKRETVLGKIKAASTSLSSGDFFIFVYSGHGGQRPDPGGDEADSQDECLLLYDREIRDDDLGVLWPEFAEGVRILTLMDACHSGTMFRKSSRRGVRREVIEPTERPLTVGLPKPGARSTRSPDSWIDASMIHISGSRDSQTAADTSGGGAFTQALLKAVNAQPRDYDQMHAKLQDNLAHRSQVSEMYVFGPGGGKFRKQRPFNLDLLTAEQISAAAKLISSVKSKWGLREATARGASLSSRGIIFSRPPKHRLDLILNGNSITDVRATAYVLGLFEGVTPAGPAAAIDDLLGGTIGAFVARRMFSAKVGEVFMLPTGNAPIQSEVVLFVGLGQLDQFLAQPEEIQKFAAGNAIRTLIQLGIDECATVLIGGGSGQGVHATLSNLVLGFVDGLRNADPGDRARRVVLCENNPARYVEMLDFVYENARSEPFEDIQLTIYERPPQIDQRRPPRGSAAVSDFRSRMFLHVRHQTVDGEDSYESILLTPGGKATAIPSSQKYDSDDRDALLRKVGTKQFDVKECGQRLAELALSSEFIEMLSGEASTDHHLIVVHDAESSKLPWETLRCGARTLALDGGISRKYLLSGDYSIAKWTEKRRFDETLDILLVVNPTEDLAGADREAEVIRRLMAEVPSVNVKEIRGKAATRHRLLTEFKSGAYDVIHYAGHAEFDKTVPENSGIFCSDRKVLSGADLAVIGDLPALVFFNACESGRVRAAPKPFKRLQESVSFAEAFLRGGIANFIGTYWPVGDASAEAFAKTFYRDIVDGEAIGDALLAGRDAVHATGSFDWADYIHYGDPDFQIKEGIDGS